MPEYLSLGFRASSETNRAVQPQKMASDKSDVVRCRKINITKTCPCNILQYFTVVKMTIFR